MQIRNRTIHSQRSRPKYYSTIKKVPNIQQGCPFWQFRNTSFTTRSVIWHPVTIKSIIISYLKKENETNNKQNKNAMNTSTSSAGNQGYLSVTERKFLLTRIPIIYQVFKTGIA